MLKRFWGVAGAAMVGLSALITTPFAHAQLDAGQRREVANNDQWTPGVYMKQAIDRVISMAGEIAKKNNVGLSVDTPCFMATPLKVGDSSSITLTLKAGRQYVFVGGGDNDVTDLDLHIKDSAGNTLKQDILQDSYPVVVFTPERDDRYTVTLELYAASASSFCAMVVLEGGVQPHPLSSINLCRDRIIQMGEVIASRGRAAGFLVQPNRWALVGTILTTGETQTLTNITTQGGSHAFVAVADNNATDIDIEVTDSNTNESIGSDVEADANPIVLLDTNKQRLYTMTVKAHNTTGQSLAFAAIITIE